MGIFQYKADAGGRRDRRKHRTGEPEPWAITRDEWTAILTEIKNRPQGSFRISGTAPFATPPNQSLCDLLSVVVPTPAGGWQWNESWKSYVSAILEHEGSIDLYHGTLGPGVGADITMASDL